MDEKALTGSDALSIQAMTDRNNGGFYVWRRTRIILHLCSVAYE